MGIFEDDDDDFLIQATNDKMANDGDDNMDDGNASDIDTPVSKAKPLPDLDGKIVRYNCHALDIVNIFQKSSLKPLLKNVLPYR